MSLQLAQTAIVEQRTLAQPLQLVAERYSRVDNRELLRLKTQALIQDLITFRTCLQLENRQRNTTEWDVTALAYGWIPHLCESACDLIRRGGVGVEDALYQHGFVYTALKDEPRKIHVTTTQFIDLDVVLN